MEINTSDIPYTAVEKALKHLLGLESMDDVVAVHFQPGSVTIEQHMRNDGGSLFMARNYNASGRAATVSYSRQIAV